MKQQETITDKNREFNLATDDHKDAICAVGKALSSPIRIDILNLVKTKPLPLQGIASLLKLAPSSVSVHIKCLEDAGLISIKSQPGIHGITKICICAFTSIHLEAYDTGTGQSDHTVTYSMPVGNYFDFSVTPTCGLAGENGIIDGYDNPASFYSTNRQDAQLIWFNTGFLEYRFPNKINPFLKLKEIAFSLELCSEAPGYSENWPSDITFSINHEEVGAYTAPGDFGDRRGKLTPQVWPMGRTQYGLLVTVSVKPHGCYINGNLANSALTLSTFDFKSSPYISFIIEAKDNAINKGGINIFGEKYGDYPQGISMQFIY